MIDVITPAVEATKIIAGTVANVTGSVTQAVVDVAKVIVNAPK